MSTAEKTIKPVSIARQQTGSTFFRKAADKSFFGYNETPAFFNPSVQPKLTISKPDDPYEKEADAVAESVMRMPASEASINTKEEEKIQRKEDSEQEEIIQPKLQTPTITALQRKASATTIQCAADTPSDFSSFAPDAVDDYTLQPKHIALHHSDVIQCSGRGPPQSFMPIEQTLQSSKGAGSAMPDSTRTYMEDRFNADFSGVRIHTGNTAQSLSTTIHAHAFTHGNDIYFNANKYAPHTTEGGLLLAHELTHTIQQGASTKQGTYPTLAAKHIQRSAIPQIDNAIAKAKGEEGKVNAGKTGSDGNRVGWDHLLDYFKTTFGDDRIIAQGAPYVLGSISEGDIKQKRMAEGMVPNQERPSTSNTYMRDAMPSWCGIFAFWALNKGGVPMKKWQLGGSNVPPGAARKPGEVPQPGDIAYRNAFSHFALVEKVNGNIITTINGNTSGEDNLGAQVQVKDHPLSNWTAFFDPLKLKDGKLQTGEGMVEEKAKTLGEMQQEIFHVNRSSKDENDREGTTCCASETALSNTMVNAKGMLQRTAVEEPVHEQDEAEKEISGGQSTTSLQTKIAGEFDTSQAHEPAHNGAVKQDANGQSSTQINYRTLTTTPRKEAIEADNRGPPVQQFTTQPALQCGWFDSAMSLVDAAIDYAAEGLEAGKRLLLNEARDFALAIPGYRALRVVLGRDPITSEGVDRNGRNFIEAAFDIMPGGRLLHEKLTELGALEEAIGWVDGRIAGIETIVQNVLTRVETFWSGLSLADLASPRQIFETAGNIIHSTITDIIDFAVTAATELLEIVKRFLVNQLAGFVRDHTTAYPLLTVILGQDPITEEMVDRNGANILNALLLLGGEVGQEQRRQMLETGTFDRVAGWIDKGIAVFANAYEQITTAISNIWQFVTIEGLMHPMDTFTAIYNQFAEPIQQVLTFVGRAAATIIAFIKEVLMQRLSVWARTVRGYQLITVIIGADPFTHEEVPRTMENIIRGFMSLMDGGEEQYNQLAESGAIGRTTQRIRAAVSRLNMTPAMVVQLFIGIWNSFSLSDLSDPVAAFRRILAAFAEPIARLVAFVVEIVRIVIEVIMQVMEFPTDLIMNIINRAMEAFERIKRDPVGFLKNLLRAIKQGFVLFFNNIVQHLLNGLTGWLLSELRDAGVTAPTDFSLQGIIAWVLEILGISMERIWQKLAAHPRIGPERVARLRGMINTLEGIWTFIRDVQERGVAAIWERIQEQLNNLWDTVLDTIKNWVMDRIINEMTGRLLSMLDPTGIMAVINSAIALYRAIQSFIQYLRQMLEVVNSFVVGVADIAAGNVATAATYLEGAMDTAMPIVIGFLANQVGLRNIGRQIAGIIERVRAMVDRALDWLIERAVTTGGRLLEMGRNAAGAVLGWLGLRREFRAANGETHSLYFEGRDENAELTMASEPRRYKRYLDTLAASATVTPQQRQNITQAQVKLDALNAEKRANRNNQGADGARITQLLTEIADLTRNLVIDDLPLSTPPVYGGLQHGFGKQVTVQKLTKNGPMGTTPSANNDTWNKLRTRLSTQGGRTFYVRGHMLNHNIHGSGSEWRNLTPLTQQANTTFETRIESQVKRMINNENKMLYFEVIADYTRSANGNKAGILAAEPDVAKRGRLENIIDAEVAVPHEIILVVDEYQKSPTGEWTDSKVNVITDHIYNQQVDGTARSHYNLV